MSKPTGRPNCACGHEHFGYKFEDGVLSKTIQGSKHILRHPRPMLAVQVDIIEFHLRDIKSIQITDSETGITYTTDWHDFIINSSSVDRGDGEQWAMPLSYWKQHKAGMKQGTLLLD